MTDNAAAYLGIRFPEVTNPPAINQEVHGEFDTANVLIHMNAGPCSFTRCPPVAKNEMISGNQQALKIPITIASVNPTRPLIWELTTTELLPDLKCFFLRLSFTRKTKIDE